MSDNVQVPGNGLQVNAGPVTVAASGSTTVQVLLAFAIVAACMYVVYTNDNRSRDMLAMLTAQHNGIMGNLNSLREANENLFLSTMLPDARKKDLPAYIQDRARTLVERRAENITEKKAPPQEPAFEVK
jgi:hypothetical protein